MSRGSTLQPGGQWEWILLPGNSLQTWGWGWGGCNGWGGSFRCCPHPWRSFVIIASRLNLPGLELLILFSQASPVFCAGPNYPSSCRVSLRWAMRPQRRHTVKWHFYFRLLIMIKWLFFPASCCPSYVSLSKGATSQRSRELLIPKWLKNIRFPCILSTGFRRYCTFGCCWSLMDLFDGASFVSWMCNLPSPCLGYHWEGLPCSVSAWQSQQLLRVPGPSCTLPYSCPTGCTETDWHPRASEGNRALPLLPPRSSSLEAAAADGLWRLNRSAHGSYCGPPIVKLKGHI